MPPQGIFASTFDVTGTRLITCEADKSIKMWKEDTSAVSPAPPLPPPTILRPVPGTARRCTTCLVGSILCYGALA